VITAFYLFVTKPLIYDTICTMKPIFLSVIIPAYNEEKRLPKTLLDVDRYLHTLSFAKLCEQNGYTRRDYEIIVVDDGSKDNTVKVVQRFIDLPIRNLRLLDNKKNHGKGWVVRHGMTASVGKYRIFMDADNSTTIDQVEKLLPFAKDARIKTSTKKGYGDYDIVIGSRGLRKSVITSSQPLYRVIVGKTINIIIQIVAVFGIWDTQCGFKLFTEFAAKNIFGKTRIDRWGFDIEALALGRKLGYKIKEVPIVWENDPESRVSFAGGLYLLVELLKIRMNLWFAKYNLTNHTNSHKSTTNFTNLHS